MPFATKEIDESACNNNNMGDWDQTIKEFADKDKMEKSTNEAKIPSYEDIEKLHEIIEIIMKPLKNEQINIEK